MLPDLSKLAYDVVNVIDGGELVVLHAGNGDPSVEIESVVSIFENRLREGTS